MNRKKISLMIALISLVVLLGLLPLYGGDPARVGTAGGVQVQVPVGPRSLAMAGANVADVQGLEAIYWNPAGLGTLGFNAGGTISTMKIFNDISVNYLALGVQAGRLGTLGFSIKAFDFGEIPVTTNQDMDGASGQTFSPTFVTAGLTYAKSLTDVISVGVTGKLVYESIPRANASAFAFDMGIQYHNLGGINGMSMGLAVKNIGSSMQYTGSAFLVQAQDAGASSNDFRTIPTAKHKLPATIELGLGYQYNINETNALLLSGNFQNQNFGDDALRFGVEYRYSTFLALRGGYLYSQGVDSEEQLYDFTAGVGLRASLGGSEIGVDYAFRNTQYFDSSNLFSLTIGF
jgi:hypothetical protein